MKAQTQKGFLRPVAVVAMGHLVHNRGHDDAIDSQVLPWCGEGAVLRSPQKYHCCSDPLAGVGGLTTKALPCPVPGIGARVGSLSDPKAHGFEQLRRRRATTEALQGLEVPKLVPNPLQGSTTSVGASDRELPPLTTLRQFSVFLVGGPAP